MCSTGNEATGPWWLPALANASWTEADCDIQSGNVSTFETMADLIDDLEDGE